jgi:predicted enzyme related to lactoylglutathione lyase
MSDAFVWFHHNSENGRESEAFYQKLLGWGSSEGPGGMTMLAVEKGPFAATGEKYGETPAWIPFVQVTNVDAATEKAVKLGAKIVREKSRGPAGEFSVVSDPAGASIALWQKA